MTKRFDRRALFASGAAAMLLAATGVSAGGLPRQGGRLRMALSGAARTDSWLKGEGLFMQVARQGLVFDTLTEVGADGTLRGELATRWTSSDDARVWQFELRDDVRFHDGAPFTAMDVVASAAGFADVVALGTHRVQFTLRASDPNLPMRFSDPEFFISPAHAMGSGIGTGIYKVVHFTPGQRLLTARVAEHYKDGKAGWFDEVELTSIPAEPVRQQALAEYLVDAVDLRDAGALQDLADVQLLPDARAPTQAVSSVVVQPARLSHIRPLDNLRAAERWWFDAGA